MSKFKYGLDSHKSLKQIFNPEQKQNFGELVLFFYQLLCYLTDLNNFLLLLSIFKTSRHERLSFQTLQIPQSISIKTFSQKIKKFLIIHQNSILSCLIKFNKFPKLFSHFHHKEKLTIQSNHPQYHKQLVIIILI